MNASSQPTASDVEELPRVLLDLGQKIATLQPAQRQELDAAYLAVVDSVRRRRRILSLVQEALSQLRLDIKYLMFDLEVTRGERDALKQRLGEEC